ncbi:MAG: helix-turn-helix transcriptional regulator [Candidatus Zixiibacteriota bacterium]|nr:MAG: helix-turn-helix transcriptional regulator [candidate division Zixibacteria bacterium]
MKKRDIEYFSQKLRELKESQNLTQVRLAEIAGVSQATISDYLLGQLYPKIEPLIKLANYFHVSLYYLTGLEELKEETDMDSQVMECIRLIVQLPNNDPRIGFIANMIKSK